MHDDCNQDRFEGGSVRRTNCANNYDPVAELQGFFLNRAKLLQLKDAKGAPSFPTEDKDGQLSFNERLEGNKTPLQLC